MSQASGNACENVDLGAKSSTWKRMAGGDFGDRRRKKASWLAEKQASPQSGKPHRAGMAGRKRPSYG